MTQRATACVASIIHAEAGKERHRANGPQREWISAAYNKTGALGLGQMRPSAWIEVAEQDGTLLNEAWLETRLENTSRSSYEANAGAGPPAALQPEPPTVSPASKPGARR
jgi:hypothetical protein